MASILNADIAGGLKATGDTSGVLQIQAGSVTVANIASSGVNAGIQVAPYAAPTFSAYYSGGGQSISAGVVTKIQYNTEEFDTNSNYDNTTNYRFTPTVAGYYEATMAVEFGANANVIIYLYKNGSSAKRYYPTTGTTIYAAQMTALIYMNGTTDYLEGYVYNNGGGTVASGSDRDRKSTRLNSSHT